MQRNLKRWIARLGLLTTMAVLATGCLSFRGGQVAKLEPTAKATTPVVEKVRLDLRVTQNGKPIPAGMMFKAAMEFHTKIALQALTNSGFFGDVQMIVPGTACWPGEFILKYEVDNWGSQAAAAASGFICGLTLFAFPGFATDHYTVRVEVLDHQGKSCWKQKYDDKMTTIIWAGFLPCLFVPPCYPLPVARATLDNIYRHSFQDLIAAKAFLVPAPASASTPNTPQAANQNNSAQQ